jgi:hypothetical protein
MVVALSERAADGGVLSGSAAVVPYPEGARDEADRIVLRDE